MAVSRTTGIDTDPSEYASSCDNHASRSDNHASSDEDESEDVQCYASAMATISSLQSRDLNEYEDQLQAAKNQSLLEHRVRLEVQQAQRAHRDLYSIIVVDTDDDTEALPEDPDTVGFDAFLAEIARADKRRLLYALLRATYADPKMMAKFREYIAEEENVEYTQLVDAMSAPNPSMSNCSQPIVVNLISDDSDSSDGDAAEIKTCMQHRVALDTRVPRSFMTKN